MIFQNPGYPLQYVNPLAQNAATVIQLPNHPYGPTASGVGGQGPYGPYWHDGTFIPYKPHAIRDPRYYPQLAQMQFNDHNMSPAAANGAFRPAFGHNQLQPQSPASSYLGHGLPSPPTVLPFSEPLSDAKAAAADAQDRERIFNLALLTYRELLSFLENVRRHNSRTNLGHTNARPGIYPKPPSSSNGHSPTQYGDSRSTFRHASESLLARTTNITAQNTVWPRANNALKSLVQLCDRTGWQWIDGLNLSGCLAYGLEDYKKALSLYNRVLELDPKHIEASANLAATLLALGHRTEAEQHWTKVIKQAPSYFEAVEHLVGLLCSSGRGKDAVKVIEHVERSLRMPSKERPSDQMSDASSMASRSPCISELSDKMFFESDVNEDGTTHKFRRDSGATEPGYGSSGYAIPGADNGRILALVHAKGNLMYAQGDNNGAARAFEDVILIATGRKFNSIKAVVRHVLAVISAGTSYETLMPEAAQSADPILLHPEQATQVAKLCFPEHGRLPGLSWLPIDSNGPARKGAVQTTSNSLLSLAKIFQDGMACTARGNPVAQLVSGVREILALYYLSLSLQPSPSTANNVGILLAGVQQAAPRPRLPFKTSTTESKVPGVVAGSGIALALAYYNYGLLLDSRHAHLYTNLGSLLKDIGQLDAAIEMYKRAVQCDGNFDIALANLANAVKDKGRISEAIDYYNRAVEVNPDFAEAVCGLANALNSVCRWKSRGGIAHDGGKQDRWHVDENGMLVDAMIPGVSSTGWIKRVVDIVEKQLHDGEDWGFGCLNSKTIDNLTALILSSCSSDWNQHGPDAKNSIRTSLTSWSGKKYEGARLLRLIERITRRVSWSWYRDKYIAKKEHDLAHYKRPQLPLALVVPSAPTVLPFHTFTSPLSAKQIRLISQRNGYRISASTLRAPWLPSTVYPPPAPPSPVLKVGYVSSDFNNHPLAHLMQSVFGLHDPNRIEAFCYATTSSDNSVHRRQIELEAPNFVDASSWSTEQLVAKIVTDGIHILINLNGYTRGARNEVFAARPAPIHMSFMGFAGTLGAEWCDYLLADSTSVPTSTLRPWRRNVDVADQFLDQNSGENDDRWVYGENIIYCRSTFFCCDHRQSAPDATSPQLTWMDEQVARWKMRSEVFPNLALDAVIFANFNQLYKIEPTTFRCWLRILARVPNAILWLLRFPDLGEANLLRTAHQWAGSAVASRVIFTDVAPKNMHISRAKIVDLFLDTPECNAHTTAADVLWSGTPLLTLPRYEYKMCSRMAASILRGALPREPKAEREQAEKDLIAASEEEYEALAVRLGNDLQYPRAESEGTIGVGRGRLVELRRLLTEARWTSDLFNTRRWVADLEDAYDEAWRRWVDGRGGDIWLEELPRGRVEPLR
ncbi:glycosyltransferase family 41 protein [Myriangium duriaei CBS 260.36]|uniref:protein O-GlcNAc transferase n=1 Tax=Myriangium duriaei CBS 260.36 TaxID=1168546 RepID=A0A9P4JCG5_9PEZI|nr:glycosyltransferase family 41 protein [Myriangium duriaei CBS 260.36]